ncbi:T9SS type A sorting domain-containing protein [Calditrichota bacterium]
MKRLLPLILFILTITPAGLLYSDTIHVPDDYDTIQNAIYNSGYRDTVLVASGEYRENVYFSGNAITLLGNPEDPSEVIIDGGGEDVGDCTVGFGSQDREEAKLCGFTIQNGYHSFGGGIDCQGSSRPIICHCIIKDNFASENGAGVYTSSSAEPLVEFCIIEDNYCTYGGATGKNGSGQPVFRNCVIRNNSSARSAVYASSGGRTIFEKCLIYNNVCGDGYAAIGNYAGSAGGVNLINCTIVNNWDSNANSVPGLDLNFGSYEYVIQNCIFWSENSDEIIVANGDDEFIEFEYNCIDQGEDGITGIDVSETNISDDPLFVDFDGDDYNLDRESPCIDAGDPDSPSDPDGSPADIGALPYFVQMMLQGYVYDAESEESLGDVRVASDYWKETTTDSTGFWSMQHSSYPDTINLTFSKEGYFDASVEVLEFEEDDTLSYEVLMYYASLDLSVDSVHMTVLEQGETEYRLELSNPGNATVEWSSYSHLKFSDDVPEWELRLNHDMSEDLNNTRISAAAYHDGRYYVASRNMDDLDKFYVLHEDLSVMVEVDQPLAEERSCIQDFTLRGDTLWMVVGDYFCAMGLYGDSLYSWQHEVDEVGGTVIGLAYDSEQDQFWAVGIRGNIFGISMDGEQEAEIESVQERIFGLAYHPNDIDGYSLWALSEGEDGALIFKYSTENYESRFVTELPTGSLNSIRSMFICEDYSQDYPVLISCNSNDRLGIWAIDARLTWLELDQKSGQIGTNESENLTLIFTDPLGMQDIYSGEIVFEHNGRGGVVSLPLCLEINENAVSDDRDPQVPVEFNITSLYPNPFNSQLNIEYILPAVSDVRVGLYDLSGRLSKEIEIGQQSAGSHAAVIDGADLVSGVYLVKLNAGDASMVRKVVLVK